LKLKDDIVSKNKNKNDMAWNKTQLLIFGNGWAENW
jgi:hypothetical protein